MTTQIKLVEQLRHDALQIFQAGIQAANPYLAVKNHLNINELTGNIHLIAFGKAACAMAKAAIELIPPERLVSAIAVTNYENIITVENVEVMGAGHPLPDEKGFQAAQKVAKIAKNATANETVLVLISGGGSALLPYPVDGVSLEEKIATTNLLLASGVPIFEINWVRKNLSQLKGGGLAKLAYPAKVHALILSDVLGDDLSTIASGATVLENPYYAELKALLVHKGIWLALPESVRQHLKQGSLGNIPETPKSLCDDILKNTCNVLCGSNMQSVLAMFNMAKQLGYRTEIYDRRLDGIARDSANKLAYDASNVIFALEHKIIPFGRVSHSGRMSIPNYQNNPLSIDYQKNSTVPINPSQPIALLAGGETTVHVTGNGKGGRNQEMALAFAIAAKKYQLPPCWVFLSGGTDGRDGVADAAGGLVDAGSLERMRKARVNPSNRLNNNDSYHALASSDDLLMTGATGTNVADLQVLLIHPLFKK